MNKCIYIYPWDLVDEGIDAVLEKVRSLGVDSVSIAVSYHAGKFVLPHNPRRKVYFPEDGVVYFPTRERYYRDTPIEPRVASVIGTQDILAQAAARCADYGLKFQTWTVCTHNTRVGTLHPEFTAVNAYGDHYIHSLCPANPEVRAYLLGLASELLENYPPDTFFVEALSYMGFVHGYHHEVFGVKFTSCQETLLGLCFCDACRARAAELGLDANRVAGIVRSKVDLALTSDLPGQSEGGNEPGSEFLRLVREHQELAAYLQMRCAVVTGLVSDVSKIAQDNGAKFDYTGPASEPTCNLAIAEGIDMERISEAIDHYVIAAHQPDPAIIDREIGYVQAKIPREKIILSMNIGENAVPSKSVFHDKVALIHKHGLAGCNLYNYGTVPMSRLEWIREIQ